MPLNIKDDETDRLARELAQETGQTITEAVRDAVEAQLTRLRRKRSSHPRTELAAVIARGRSRPTIDSRPEEEILGYTDSGLPA